jgi:hypothetical protein
MGCGTNTPTPTMTSPVPATVQLLPFEIAFRGDVGDSPLFVWIGTGKYSTGLAFQCLMRIISATGLPSCPLAVNLDTNSDYWAYVTPLDAGVRNSDGLMGGVVLIRNQRVSRTFRLSGSSSSAAGWTAGLFQIVDANGTIR